MLRCNCLRKAAAPASCADRPCSSSSQGGDLFGGSAPSLTISTEQAAAMDAAAQRLFDSL